MKPLIALILVLLFGVATLVLLRTNPAPNSDAVRAAERLKALQTQQADDHTHLTTYERSESLKGGFQISIERAMELTIPELNARPPAAVPSSTP